MNVNEANTLLNESRTELGLPSTTEYIWFCDKEDVTLDGTFTLGELKKLISFMESIED